MKKSNPLGDAPRSGFVGSGVLKIAILAVANLGTTTLGITTLGITTMAEAEETATVQADPVIIASIVREEDASLLATIAIEAESFAEQRLDEIRQWSRFDSADHAEDAASKNCSDDAFIRVLPDTRRTHDDKLIRGENFSPEPGKMAVLDYRVRFPVAGQYRVWARAFSTGTEDNGLHVGINGDWPESGQRIQWCDGKGQWTWSSAQRTEQQHCGVPMTISIDVPVAGVHTVSISMREDGVKLDKLIVTNDMDYRPEGIDVVMQTLR